MIITKIQFQCCGSTVKTHGKGTGSHTDYCLSCDTANPDYDTEYNRV